MTMELKLLDRIKLWIIKIFKIKTYAKEYLKLEAKYENLQKNYKMAQNIIESYKHDLEVLQNKCNIVIQDAENILSKYENPDRVKETYEHRAYANGRRDAYAEMGIKALNKRLVGESLYLDYDDNIITEDEYKRLEEFCNLNEIDIDDLEDVK